MSTASKVAERKAANPEKYCPVSRCLWSTGGGYCPRHQHLAPKSPEALQVAKDAFLEWHSVNVVGRGGK